MGQVIKKWFIGGFPDFKDKKTKRLQCRINKELPRDPRFKVAKAGSRFPEG